MEGLGLAAGLRLGSLLVGRVVLRAKTQIG